MNLTTTVMMLLVSFLLCSGFSQLTFASNRLRIFSLEGKGKWEAGLSKCEEKGGSLVTLYDEEDANFTKQYFKVWLGLTKTRNVTTWSNGDPYTFKHSSIKITNGEQKCEAIESNTWKGFNCLNKKIFMCYKDDKYVLIDKKKSWCQAEQYCREQHNSHLVSISNEDQNQKVIEEGKNKTFWIGLLHDEWEWVDQTCSTYRPAFNLQGSPDSDECTVYSLYFPKMIKRHGCDNNEKVLCSKGDVIIRVINKNKTWEEALEYCEKHHTSLLWMKDLNDQKAVKQWLDVNEITGTFWIGLRQSTLFGFWIWKDRPVSVSNWNDQTPELPFSHQCGVLKTTDDYKWSDENCFHMHHFMCEEKIFKMNV